MSSSSSTRPSFLFVRAGLSHPSGSSHPAIAQPGDRRIRGEQQAISVSDFRIMLGRSRGPAFWIGFSQDDRSVPPLGKRSNNLKTTPYGGKLTAHPHLHMAVLD